MEVIHISKHFVRIKRPIVGSILYLAKIKSATQSPYYYDFVSYLNGKLVQFEEVDIPCERFSQGRRPDQFGNKEVEHVYIDGDITLIPITSGSLLVRTYSNPLSSPNIGERMAFSISLKSGTQLAMSSYYDSYHNNTYKSDILNECHPLSFSRSTKYPPTSEASGSEGVCTFSYPELYSGNCSYNQIESSFSTTKSGITTKTSKVTNGTTPLISCGVVLASSVLPEYKLTIPPAAPVPDSFLVDLLDKIGTPQVNNCENIMQLKKWRDMVPPLKKLVQKRNIKSLAELYLWWKYSYKTSELDIIAYFNWIKSWLNQKHDPVNSAHYSLTYEVANNDILRYNVYMSPYSIGVIEFLGLDINLSNTWDMLPFSFILDWFVNVGEVLHSLDTSNLRSQVSLKSLMCSRKRVVRTEYDASVNIVGSITRTFYSRQLQTSLPASVCSLHFNDPSKHLLDASSLVIANKR